eukprot:TRINITY_DN29153_c0_g1_i1.p1 TRINITY_DN29153_c0_g1~~TRINITY_DN29153_c0_g1_i1.p1  ORF type:complete len:302 (+),score=56.20 TRINITY_DN29153_c0_g1_i1:62-967(+)
MEQTYDLIVSVCCCRRRGPGAARLRSFAWQRKQRLQSALQAEATAAYHQTPASKGIVLDEQCLKDFDRAHYQVGDDEFKQGEGAESGDFEKARKVFEERFIAECAEEGTDEAAEARLIAAVSVLASQIVMAHLSAACFSGPHSYALPSGSAKPFYHVRRVGNAMRLRASRSAEGFEIFSLPDGEEHACNSKLSYSRQSIEIEMKATKGKEEIKIQVLEVEESLRLAWPDERVVVHDGLPLDIRSPPDGGPGLLIEFLAIPFAAVLVIGQRVLELHQALLPKKLQVLLPEKLRSIGQKKHKA